MYLKDFEPNFVFCQSYESYQTLSKKIKNRYYEAPKLISDVFEAILGAILADGGYNEVVRVLQHILGPFVWMVAKYHDKIRKNPAEEFQLFCSSKGLTPRIETYTLGSSKERNWYDSDENDNQDYGYPKEEQPKDKPHITYKWAIIHQGRKQLCKSYGNTKEQAKRNACILGYAKLREELKMTGELEHSSEDFTHTHDSENTQKINEKNDEDEDSGSEVEEEDDIYADSD